MNSIDNISDNSLQEDISDNSLLDVVFTFQQMLDSKCAVAKANDNLVSLKKRVQLAYAQFILTFIKSCSPV